MRFYKKKWHRITSFAALICLSLALLPSCSTKTTSSTAGASEEEAGTLRYTDISYSVEDAENNQILLKNYSDGYSLLLPAEYRSGMEITAVCTKAGCDTEDIRIFFEQFSTEDELASYRSYSNTSIYNDTDIYQITEDSESQNGNLTIYTLRWQRTAIEGLTNDKPYYSCIDIVYHDKELFKEKPYLVWTLYFRSQEEIKSEKLQSFISSFEQIKKQTHKRTSEPANPDQTLTIRSYWTDETTEFYKSHFSSSASLDWGTFLATAPAEMDELKSLEEKTNYRFDILVRYCHFDVTGVLPQVFTDLDNAATENRFLELTLQTASSEENAVYGILRGDYDTYLKNFAEAIRRYARPTLLRLCNEMNGDWCPYSAFQYARDTDLFIQMYQYVYDKFEEYGALPYTIWVWNPNERAYPNYKWNFETQYFPGDKYVDVIGLTGYNTGTYYEGETWRTFDEIYAKPYLSTIVNYRQPIMITEFASSSVGGDKVEWIEDMFAKIKNYDRIKIAIWWNGRDLDAEGNVARPYWYYETDDTLKAFRDGISAYGSNKDDSGSVISSA